MAAAIETSATYEVIAWSRSAAQTQHLRATAGRALRPASRHQDGKAVQSGPGSPTVIAEVNARHSPVVVRRNQPRGQAGGGPIRAWRISVTRPSTTR
jgi:hypothetical protein